MIWYESQQTLIGLTILAGLGGTLAKDCKIRVYDDFEGCKRADESSLVANTVSKDQCDGVLLTTPADTAGNSVFVNLADDDPEYCMLYRQNIADGDPDCYEGLYNLVAREKVKYQEGDDVKDEGWGVCYLLPDEKTAEQFVFWRASCDHFEHFLCANQ